MIRRRLNVSKDQSAPVPPAPEPEPEVEQELESAPPEPKAETNGSSQVPPNGADGAADVPEDLDPFADPSKLVISQDFGRAAGVEKLLTVVPVRKPLKHDFVRVHPDPGFRMSPAGIVELREEREVYLVMPHLAAELAGEYRFMTLYMAVNSKGVPFIWPIPLPEEGGRKNLWAESGHEAAAHAVKSWVRVTANMSLGAYEIKRATTLVADPEWPAMPFGELLKIAFRGYLIGSLDHPVVRRLRGLE